LVDKTPAELDPGTPSDTSIVHASENGVSTNSKGHDERNISRLQGTAPLYSSSKTYNLNDLVTESGDVFRNTTAITVPEAFNPSKWTSIGAGESNTASNLGAGEGTFAQKNGVDLEFKSLVAGANITISSTATEITINGEDAQREIIEVRNTTGSLIPKGSAVFISGSAGNKSLISLAQANASTTEPAIGITESDIANNSDGFVVIQGVLDGLDTSSFLVGDLIFVSATTPGGLVSTAPSHPNVQQFMGVVLVSNVAIGEIQILTGQVSGLEQGTISNTFKIGDNQAGTKILEFANGFSQQIKAIPTANRVQDLQDKDGTIALLEDAGLELLANDTLAVTSDTFDSTVFPAREFIRVLVYLESVNGSLDTDCRFDGDAGAKYAYRRFTNFSSDSSFTNDTEIEFDIGTPDISQFAVIQIWNPNGLNKLFNIQSQNDDGGGAGTVPNTGEIAGKFVETTQVTQVNLINTGGGDYLGGACRMLVFGSIT